MKKTPLTRAVVLAAAVLLSLIVSCKGAAPEALGPGTAQPPAPTPVPAQTREAAVAFVREYQSISQEWDRWNADMDQWRAGLTACDRPVGQSALDGFAARANQITQATLKLPRQPALRELADQVIQAAEKQDTALRRLSGGWQPSSPSLQESVEAERFAAARMWVEARDGLDDLRTQTDASNQPAVRQFSAGLQSANATWDRVHQNFDSYLTQTGPAATDSLNQAVVGISEVVTAIRALPNTPGATQWAWALAEAATAEEQTLRKLRAPELAEDAKKKARAAVDVQIHNSNAVRGRIQRQVSYVLNTPVDNVRAVADFSAQFGAISQDWDKLQLDYDGWRYGRSGCDAGKVSQALDQLAVRASALAGRAQNLPSVALLRSLQEPFSEAAVRQADAVKALRVAWRPYAADLYRALDQERRTAADQRRQVAAGVQDLQARLGLPVAAP